MAGNKIPNYYDILGVDRLATTANIEKAKDRLKFGGPDDRAPFRMWNKIDEAYTILSNPEKRKEYDKKIESDTIEEVKETSVVQQINNNLSIPVTRDINEILMKKDYTNSSEAMNVEENSQDFPQLKKIGKNIVLAIPTAILATINIIKDLSEAKKYKLSKESSIKQITEVKTLESELIEKYRSNLDKKIDKVLTEYHTNYNLEIDRLRYKSNIDLLNRIIQHKENEFIRKEHSIIKKLHLISLKAKLKTYINGLEKVEEKLNQKNNSQKLSRIYEDLFLINRQLKNTNLNNSSLNKLKIKRRNLLNKKELKIQKIKSNREYYAIFKDNIMTSHSIVGSLVDNALTKK